MRKTTKLLDYLAFEEKQIHQCLLKTVARCLANSNGAVYICCQCCFIYGYKSLPHMYMINFITLSSLKVTKVLQGDHYYLIYQESLIFRGMKYFVIMCVLINNIPQPLACAASLLRFYKFCLPITSYHALMGDKQMNINKLQQVYISFKSHKKTTHDQESQISCCNNEYKIPLQYF